MTAPRHDPFVARALRRARAYDYGDNHDIDFAHLRGSEHVSLVLKARAFHRPSAMRSRT